MFYVSRFKDIERREYECEVVTPLFLGGADPEKAELRAPPIKAAMRFWWRALYEGNDVKQMADDEAAVFGSTEKKAVLSVSMDISEIKPESRNLPPGKKIMVTSKGKTFPISIVEYLAYGLFDPKQKKYLRQYFDSSKKFKIVMSFPKTAERDVVKAMNAMINFGGFGARSRNGFGSLHCPTADNKTMKNEGALKTFTSFSNKSVLFNKFSTFDNWQDALSELGVVYRAARLKLEDRHKFDERGLIAMPIESQFERNIPFSIKNGRHAKPYFLHVNKTTDGKYQGQILFLPYRYKPADDKAERVNEYMEVCNKMNKAIQDGMGGAR
jgi:CRISPR-associated protein Cmr1